MKFDVNKIIMESLNEAAGDGSLLIPSSERREELAREKSEAATKLAATKERLKGENLLKPTPKISIADEANAKEELAKAKTLAAAKATDPNVVKREDLENVEAKIASAKAAQETEGAVKKAASEAEALPGAKKAVLQTTISRHAAETEDAMKKAAAESEALPGAQKAAKQTAEALRDEESRHSIPGQARLLAKKIGQKGSEFVREKFTLDPTQMDLPKTGLAAAAIGAGLGALALRKRMKNANK